MCRVTITTRVILVIAVICMLSGCEYQDSGFNEEAFFYIEWESEDTFTLKYDDEAHNGMYAEEYQFDLNQ